MLTAEDKVLLEKKGISEEKIAEQLACFEKGFPFLKLDGAASIEKGILAPAEDEMKAYLEAWDAYMQGEKKIVKFVHQESDHRIREFPQSSAFVCRGYACHPDYDRRPCEPDASNQGFTQR